MYKKILSCCLTLLLILTTISIPAISFATETDEVWNIRQMIGYDVDDDGNKTPIMEDFDRSDVLSGTVGECADFEIVKAKDSELEGEYSFKWTVDKKNLAEFVVWDEDDNKSTESIHEGNNVELEYLDEGVVTVTVAITGPNDYQQKLDFKVSITKNEEWQIRERVGSNSAEDGTELPIMENIDLEKPLSGKLGDIKTFDLLQDSNLEGSYSINWSINNGEIAKFVEWNEDNEKLETTTIERSDEYSEVQVECKSAGDTIVKVDITGENEYNKEYEFTLKVTYPDIYISTNGRAAHNGDELISSMVESGDTYNVMYDSDNITFDEEIVKWEIVNGNDIVGFRDGNNVISACSGLETAIDFKKAGSAEIQVSVYDQDETKTLLSQINFKLNISDVYVAISQNHGEKNLLRLTDQVDLKIGDSITLGIFKDEDLSNEVKKIIWTSDDEDVIKMTSDNSAEAMAEGQSIIRTTIDNVELTYNINAYAEYRYQGCSYSISQHNDGSYYAILRSTDDSENSGWTGQIPKEILVFYPNSTGKKQAFSVEEIDGKALADTTKECITIPESVGGIWNEDSITYGSNTIKEYKINGNNPKFSVDKGVLYAEEKALEDTSATKYLFLYPNKKTDKKYTIPDDVDFIEQDALNNDQLKLVIVPDGFTFDEDTNPFLNYAISYDADDVPTEYSIELEVGEHNTDVIQWAKEHNIKYTIRKNSNLFSNNNRLRVYGDSRYDTAVDAADAMKKSLGIDKFENIIVADGRNYPDALTGSYLAKVKDAPILLVNDSSASMIREYIKQNLKSGGTVYILGGTGAVSGSFEKSVRNTGASVKRLAGKSRYDTNISILKEAGVTKGDLLICSGGGFADSLSASAAGLPILLTGDTVSPEQKAYLNSLSIDKIYIIGGTGAVKASVEDTAKRYGTVERLAGKSRYDTSEAVAKKFFGGKASAAVIAYGQNFPDGLAGGPLAMTLDAPLLLAENGAYSQAAGFVEKEGIKKGIVMGGRSLISDSVFNRIIK